MRRVVPDVFRALTRALSRVRAVVRRGKLNAEMAEEMRLHLELQTEKNRRQGLSVEDARHAALRDFGNVGVIQQTVREQRGWRGFEELLADLRFAARMLGKHPGFTLAAVLTLAVGIGFVTTLFTMVNGLAYGQLPFEHPERIVSIEVPAPQFDDYADRQHSCESFAFVQPVSTNLRAGNFVSRYEAAIVSSNFLDALKTRPILGRGFIAEDAKPGASPSVLIGHAVWMREFSGSPGVIGESVRINGEPHAIVGVMAKGFGFPFNQEVWLPRREKEPITGGVVFGRLRPEVSARQAADEFTAISRIISSAGNAVGRHETIAASAAKKVDVVPFAQRGVKDALRMMLMGILGATFVVLLLACANVANLMLARAMDRRKELAVRAALGASRGRLIRQMLTESLLVSVLGALGGLGLATWSTHGLWVYMMKERPLTGGAPFWINVDVDGRVFLFVTVVTLLASVATGLVPALQASRVDLNDTLKQGGGAGLHVSRFTGFLVNAQMAFSVCLVTVAGLFVTILVAFNHKSLPYDPNSVLTARISLDDRTHDDTGARTRFFEQLVDRLNAKPGVQAAALTSSEALRNSRTSRIEIEGATYANERERPECVMDTVSTNFLEGYGVRLVSGRSFDAHDGASTPPVAVVNTQFVERFGGDLNFIGRRFRLAGDSTSPSPWITIIGIAPEIGSVKAGRATRGAVIYRPLGQETDRAMTVLIRGGGDVSRFAETLRREVAALDPDLPVARMQTVEEIIELERIGMNTFGSLFVVCGFGALLLASIGIYGVISFAVKLRTREFGVRMALGAERTAITRMVFAQGVRQIAIGLGVGALLAIAASVVVKSIFVGFSDPNLEMLIRGVAVTLLALVAGAALLIPARRAANVSPMEALRCE